MTPPFSFSSQSVVLIWYMPGDVSAFSMVIISLSISPGFPFSSKLGGLMRTAKVAPSVLQGITRIEINKSINEKKAVLLV